MVSIVKIKKNKYPVLRYDQIQDITKTILGYEWFSSLRRKSILNILSKQTLANEV